MVRRFVKSTRTRLSVSNFLQTDEQGVCPRFIPFGLGFAHITQTVHPVCPVGTRLRDLQVRACDLDAAIDVFEGLNELGLFVFLEIDFRQVERVLGSLDIAFILTFLNVMFLVRGNPGGLGLVDFDSLILELLDESGRIQFHELVAFDNLDPWIDDPLDRRRDGAPLGSGPDRTDDVAVLGRFQRAALDDGNLESFRKRRSRLVRKMELFRAVCLSMESQPPKRS